jgi:general secretion pathway protein H
MRISATPNDAEHGFTSLRRSAELGFTSLRRSAELGFTLIELMVVIAIIGLMSAAVIFNLPDPRGNLVDEAERFAARVVAARDEAVITARETRVRVTQTGYAFDKRRRGEWTVIDGKPLLPSNWAEGTQASAAEIIFDPTGLASETQRVLISRDGARVAVDFGMDGTIRVAG